MVDVAENVSAKTAEINVTSSFLFNFEVVGEPDPDAACTGQPPPINFSGQSSREASKSVSFAGKNLEAEYLGAIGPMLEETENKFRSGCEKIQLPKASEIMGAMVKQRIGGGGGGARSPKRSAPGGPPRGMPGMGGLMGDLGAALAKRRSSQ